MSRLRTCLVYTSLNGDVHLVATPWEWAEEIDQARAEASKKRAEEILARKDLDAVSYTHLDVYKRQPPRS